MSGFSFYNDERSDITHPAGAVARDTFLPRFPHIQLIWTQSVFQRETVSMMTSQEAIWNETLWKFEVWQKNKREPVEQPVHQQHRGLYKVAFLSVDITFDCTSNKVTIIHVIASLLWMVVARKCALGDACDMVSVQKDGKDNKSDLSNITNYKVYNIHF